MCRSDPVHFEKFTVPYMKGIVRQGRSAVVGGAREQQLQQKCSLCGRSQVGQTQLHSMASVVPTSEMVCIPAVQALRRDRLPRKARHGAVQMQVRAAAATEQVRDRHAIAGATGTLPVFLLLSERQQGMQQQSRAEGLLCCTGHQSRGLSGSSTSHSPERRGGLP